MSYRLFATRPQIVHLGGTPLKVQPGTPLHLSDEDATRILNSPLGKGFHVVSRVDPETPPSYGNLNLEIATKDFSPSQEAKVDTSNPHDTPMPESAKGDQLKETYSSYERDGEMVFETLQGHPSHSGGEEENLEEVEEHLQYEKQLLELLPANYNWKSIVSLLGKLSVETPLPTGLITYIGEKYAYQASVKAEVEKLLGQPITPTQEAPTAPKN